MMGSIFKKPFSKPSKWRLVTAKTQEESDYVALLEFLETISCRAINKIFNFKNFDRIAWNTKVLKIALFCSSALSATSLMLGLIIVPTLEFSEPAKQASVILIAASAIIYMARYILKRQPEQATKEQLIKETHSHRASEEVLDILDQLIAHKIPLFIRAQDGKILKLPISLMQAHNRYLFLLGEPKHKSAIFMTGALPKQQLLISKQDAQSLFSVLEIITSDNTVNKPNNRKNDYLYTVLNNKSALKVFLETMDTPDFSETLKAHPVRAKWKKALEYIYEHWDSWQAYRDNEHLRGNMFKFSRELAECLGTSVTKQTYKDFRRSRNRNLNNWIKASFAISDDFLLSYESIL